MFTGRVLARMRLTLRAARLGIYSPCLPLLVGARQCSQLSATQTVGSLCWYSSILLFHNPASGEAASVVAANVSTLCVAQDGYPTLP